jgi:hypothetical protein
VKKVKNYIEADLAKRKIARYKYWSIKDENGITIVASDDNPDGQSFGDFLDKIIGDNVDAEVQVKYGTNEQSSRQNPPFFILINQDIEWIDPEQDDSVRINGIPHKVDKNGNVNINLTTPEQVQTPVIEPANIDTFRQEMEIQLSGLKKEYELKEEKWQIDMTNKLMEQTLKFKEMMLAERESRIVEREAIISQKESELTDKEAEIKEDVKGYLNQVPSVLGGLIKDWVKGSVQKKSALGKAEPKPGSKEPKRTAVQFEIDEEGEPPEIDIKEFEEMNFNENEGINEDIQSELGDTSTES